MEANDVVQELNKISNPNKAKELARYFKTGKGEYGEGDIFIGITVPEQRKIAKIFKDLKLSEIQKLLKSKIHEHRLTALMILSEKELEQTIFDFYLKNTKYINNWDLVDSTARDIVGQFLFDKDRSLLYELAKSDNLWEKRVAIIATNYFINKKEYKDTIEISKILLSDKHDLLHKAVGWMLREVGKKDKKVLVDFLNENIKAMPRTTLRYSIERFSPEERQYYLKK